MEDDERAVDWAPRKIRELQAALGEVMGSLRILERNTAENGRRLAALEGYPREENVMAFGNPERPRPEVFEVKWPMQGRWLPAVREDEKLEDVPLDRWVGEAIGAVSTCWEPRPKGVFQSSMARWICDSVMARIDEAVAQARATPVKRGCRLCPPEMEWDNDAVFIDHLRTHLDLLSKPNGAEATRRTVIELAEKRIRDYMNGHFSDATIGGVVRALKGIPPIPAIAEYDDRKNSDS